MRITYVGTRRTSGRVDVFVEERHEDGFVSMKRLDPGPSQALWNHSPDGFEWGYHGSGPAQLALAILYDAAMRRWTRRNTAGEIAIRYHQEFKRMFVAAFPREGFRLRLSEEIASISGLAFLPEKAVDTSVESA